jgi:Uma2 family endonuclease
MTPPASASLIDDIALYPCHEEDDVPETPPHRRHTVYLYDALKAHFTQGHVISNACIYWIPGDTETYLAPDVFVVNGRRTRHPPRVHRMWVDPPVIFVAEIGSRSSFRRDRGPKLDDYRDHVQATEYLYTDPVELSDEEFEPLTPGHLHFWRLTAEGYVSVEPEANGRFRSEQLDLEIGVDEDGELRLYTPEGEALLYYEEEQQARENAEDQARAEARERLAAEQRAQTEARGRLAAEQRARDAENLASQAEERASEAERTAAAEREQREALERQLAALQARLQRDNS